MTSKLEKDLFDFKKLWQSYSTVMAELELVMLCLSHLRATPMLPGLPIVFLKFAFKYFISWMVAHACNQSSRQAQAVRSM